MAMIKLVCAVCKFTLVPESADESATYAQNVPMHCSTPMVLTTEGSVSPEKAAVLAKEAAAWDASKDGSVPAPGAGGWKDAPEALINPPKPEEKSKKKGLFGLGGKSKKK